MPFLYFGRFGSASGANHLWRSSRTEQAVVYLLQRDAAALTAAQAVVVHSHEGEKHLPVLVRIAGSRHQQPENGTARTITRGLRPHHFPKARQVFDRSSHLVSL